MKATIIIFIFLASFGFALAQKNAIIMNDYNSPVNIKSEKINKSFTPPPSAFNTLKSATEKKSEIQVVFVDFPEEAKTAFLYATSIWETILSSQVPIQILAKWETCETNILAKSKPSVHYKAFDQSIIKEAYYPVALAEKLSGKDLNNGEPDIYISFNKNSTWYFDTDGNTPENKYDFVTAVLHEITHGLGFSGFISDADGSGFFNNSNNAPSIYDYYIFNIYNQQLANKTLFASPSTDLHKQLTSEKLKFHFAENKVKSAEETNWIYAPATWKNGASIYHLNETFNNDVGLMSAYAYKGKAIHNPGKKTIDILSDLGWKSVCFNFCKLKDIEEKVDNLPVCIDIISDIEIDNKSVQLVFSTDYFATNDSISLNYDTQLKKFKGLIPLNYKNGTLKYYFKVQTVNNIEYRYPGTTSGKVFGLRFGMDDYFPPATLNHNPVKLVPNSIKSLDLTAIAEDNVGINKVTIEYKIDGVAQNPVELNNLTENIFNGIVELPQNISEASKIEYRVVAEDLSKRKNKKMLPGAGYYSVTVFETSSAVSSYFSDFNSSNTDFVTNDFTISTLPGFSDGMLHSQHPYQTSVFDNENYNLIAQLKSPVIIRNEGEMSFDEIVLVEPGENGTKYTDLFFWDYAIVEASKDNGVTWIPITEGYDALNDECWKNEFSNNIINDKSVANGNSSMFRSHVINLTDNTGLKKGDEVLFRFRLSSDKSVNGWGWAIDNLEIQTLYTDAEDILAVNAVTVYPNPCNDYIYVDCSDLTNASTVKIIVTDLLGKTAFSETWTDSQFNPGKQVDLSKITPGIYLVNIIDNAFNITTKKIIKN